ncbi:MAG: tyrosine--tRNA ligase [Thermodesulfobacteriota bacterium]|nr:tyrosine--tRNA ligase [Thermodesulfobacteriota bacterium]
MNFIDELKWRGLVYQVSDQDKVRDYCETPGRALYCGFDPTAPSLHIGNLVPLIALLRAQRCGHNPIVLMGGATGLIGDPSGKDKERELLSEERINASIENIKAQVTNLFGGPVQVVNNHDWTRDVSAIELLRDIGKHFTVNWMMAKESVKARIDRDESGISYTEFSYMILQAFDFYYLAREQDCLLQIGGSDQWGNITAGTELVRRKLGREAYALTFPLITTATGAKFGKSEKGAIYLDPERTSPYEFYQYWVNTDDRDVIRFLKYFTLLDQEAISALEQDLESAPHLRAAQKELARAMTEMVHGKDEVRKIINASEVLFGKGGGGAKLDARLPLLEMVGHAVSSREYARDNIPSLAGMLFELGLVKSKSQAKRDIKAGAVSVNDKKILDVNHTPTADDFLNGEVLILRKGKKNYGLIYMKD